MEDKKDENRVPGAALILPRGKEVILQAEEKDYKRGLLVELTEEGGYKIKYWYGDDVKVYLRDWFKKEDWVRIDSSGNIAGPCGTSKNQKNPDRCLPRKKAQSLTKAQRKATAAKKKKAGSKGKQVVPNTKKAKVKLKK